MDDISCLQAKNVMPSRECHDSTNSAKSRVLFFQPHCASPIVNHNFIKMHNQVAKIQHYTLIHKTNAYFQPN